MSKEMLEHPRKRADIKNYPGDNRCPAGHHDLFVSFRGEETPCPFLPISYGNIRCLPLEVIRDKIVRDPLFRQPSSRCLAGEDPEFARRFLRPIFQPKAVPISVEVHKEMCQVETRKSEARS